MIQRLRTILGEIRRTFLENNAPWIVALLYGDFWRYRSKAKRFGYTPRLYRAYLSRLNSFIGIRAEIAAQPEFPHGMRGIFISNSARIGRNVIIYHHVTIGSNTLPGSKGYGAPTIGDGVFIGAGAKIIGNVEIGENARIGAGCIVTRSVPANSVVVMAAPRVIQRGTLENIFVENQGDII